MPNMPNKEKTMIKIETDKELLHKLSYWTAQTIMEVTNLIGVLNNTMDIIDDPKPPQFAQAIAIKKSKWTPQEIINLVEILLNPEMVKTFFEKENNGNK